MLSQLSDLISLVKIISTRKDASFGVIPVYKNKSNYLFLLIQNKKNNWSFPKGHKHLKETDLQAALRELKEETGITDCKILENVYFDEQYSIKKLHIKADKTVRFYLGFVPHLNVKIPKTEVKNYRWVNTREALNLITYPQIQNILKQARKTLIKN